MAWVRAARWSVVAGAVVTWTASAAAEPGKLVLRWDAPSECPTETEVRRSVEQLLGATEVALEADASVARHADGFHLALHWRTEAASATRELTGESCGELAQAAALMIALAADPSLPAPAPTTEPAREGATSPRPDAPAVTPPPATSPAAEPSSPPPREPAPEPPARFVLSPRLGGAVDVGSLPRPAVGGYAGAGLRYGRYGLVVEALAFAPKETDEPVGGGRFWLGAASVRPCLMFGAGPFRLAPCAAVELHGVPSRGLRVRTFEERVAWFLRAGAGAELAFPLGTRVRLGLQGALLFAPARPRFVVDAEEVFRPSPWAGRVQLGFELDL